MQITISLGELNEIVASLNNFVKQPLSAKWAYRFQKAAKTLQTEWTALRQQHEELVRKYGVLSEDGKQIQVTSDNFEAYSKEHIELLSEVFTLEFEPMPLSAMEDNKISIQDMAWLERFFTDDSIATPSTQS